MANINELESTVRTLATKGKGILAADESTPTITKRFDAAGIPSSEEMRRDYRELLITTPDFSKWIAGVIFYEETLNQKISKGMTFPDYLKEMGVIPGIKVDKGLTTLPFTQDENVTQGLDGLAERLAQYYQQGARFTKWRATYLISDKTPSALAIHANAEVLARYAAIAQSQGFVPIVEPEVLLDGDHTIARCEEVSRLVLQAVFKALNRYKVILECMVLKPSMVLSGKTNQDRANVSEVAKTTVKVLRQTVPAAVPTINFLSGGQTPTEATAHLNAMNQIGNLPWNVSFSYARALQDDCMKTWLGQAKNITAAQKAFSKRAMLNSLAAMGKYEPAMEKEEISLAS